MIRTLGPNDAKHTNGEPEGQLGVGIQTGEKPIN